MPYYAHINLEPSLKPQRYVIPSVALLCCVALPSLRLYPQSWLRKTMTKNPGIIVRRMSRWEEVHPLPEIFGPNFQENPSQLLPSFRQTCPISQI
jgi:hypothetical protein